MNYEQHLTKIPFDSFKTPSYVIDSDLLKNNLEILKKIETKTEAKILLAQKAFSMYSLYPLIDQYLSGYSASSLFEAKLANEYGKGEIHVFSPAYREEEFISISSICSHIIFNSFAQLKKFENSTLKSKIGIRINPEFSCVKQEIYNPCSEYSRLGVTLNEVLANEEELKNVSGIHFHTMCEQEADVLGKTLEVVVDKFEKFLKRVEWLNIGGGQLITKKNYDINLLCDLINFMKSKYDLKIFLEPGEAIGYNAGFLVSSVIDIIERNEKRIAILDTSAACHMPDVLEMPYKPNVIGAKSDLPKNYILAGPTCLSGDVIGEYSFEHPLKIGQKIVFSDMAHYTMVKNNTFNGINLPSILVYKDGEIVTIKEFCYEDFKSRL